jgi:hypothetical protein
LPAVGDAAVRDAWGVYGDYDDGYAAHAWAAGAHGGGHVCRPRHSGDPFLIAVYDVVFAVGGLLRGGLDVGNVGLFGSQLHPYISRFHVHHRWAP